MFRFEKLEIWRDSIQYSKKIYSLADTLPKHELFGLSPQLKRAALSISSNIAEGSGSSSKKDFMHFLDIAIKSTIETVSQLLFGKEMGYFKKEDIETLYMQAEILIKKIYSFKYSLNKNK